jgi:4-hydroxy-4-methyl-2-oxoglutarate aldolase
MMETSPSALTELTTAALADACLRLGIELRAAPAGLHPLIPGTKAAGRVLPVQHAGSVDVFLEAFGSAGGGEVLVIDNAGRTDEACIGDLTVIEARAAGIGALLVWGLHRDTDEVIALDLPVFTYGSFPSGPLSARPRAADSLTSAEFGDFRVTADDVVLADSDGAIFVPLDRLEELVDEARVIIEKERAQADRVKEGTTLRRQMRFAEFLTRREADPSYTFRQHLREVGGEIEE